MPRAHSGLAAAAACVEGASAAIDRDGAHVCRALLAPSGTKLADKNDAFSCT